MELLSIVLVLGLLGGVYVLILKPPSAGAKERRSWLLDGRSRDRDPFDGSGVSAAVLCGVAIGDLAKTADSVGLDATFALGLLLSVALAMRGLRELIYLLVGISALVNTLVGLVFGDACGGALTGGQRIFVLGGTALFLAVIAGSRLIFAPLRARGPAQASAFLAVYGVITSAAYAAQLHRGGGLSDWGWRSYAVAVICLLALAVGIAVQPKFALAVLGVAIAGLAFYTDGTTSCLNVITLVGVLAGFVVGRLLIGAVRRRR